MKILSDIKKFNAEIRGLSHYYQLAHNVSVLGKFTHIMEYSMYKTFACKDIRMYYVKRMKDLTDSTEWDRLMKKMRRKSLAACKDCFDKIHS